MSSFGEQRAKVMEMADEINRLRQEFLAAVATMNMGIARLVEESERLLPGAVEQGPVKHFKTKDPSPAEVAAHEAPSGRRCSNCGEVGHTAPTCMNKRAEKEPVKKEKKKRKPLTDEQRQRLVETLKKAREVRAKKRGQ